MLFNGCKISSGLTLDETQGGKNFIKQQKKYFWVATRHWLMLTFIDFSKIFQPLGAYYDPPLTDIQEKVSDQDVFNNGMLFFNPFKAKKPI